MLLLSPLMGIDTTRFCMARRALFLGEEVEVILEKSLKLVECGGGEPELFSGVELVVLSFSS